MMVDTVQKESVIMGKLYLLLNERGIHGLLSTAAIPELLLNEVRELGLLLFLTYMLSYCFKKVSVHSSCCLYAF